MEPNVILVNQTEKSCLFPSENDLLFCSFFLNWNIAIWRNIFFLNLEFKSKIEYMYILTVNSKYAKHILENEQWGFCPFQYRLISTSIKLKYKIIWFYP